MDAVDVYDKPFHVVPRTAVRSGSRTHAVLTSWIYNLNPLLRRRHQQLVDAQAFNEWLSNRSLAAVCERKLNLQLAKRDGIWTSQTTKDEGQEILCLLGRRWARAQRVLVRYDAETKTVLSYLCELVQRASERSYLAKRGFARVTSHFFLDDYLNAPDPVSETPFLLDSDDGGRRLSEAVSGNQAGGALTALGEGALAAGVVH
ncbi:unnamed protein product [Symbiodinium sp. KB8]|nr:unnamed protein product [Symbiodinium sp. KB8]